MKNTMLTKKQKNILDYLNQYLTKNGYSPTYEEIRKHFKLSSVSNIHQHIETLKAKGYLKKVKNKPRTINVIAAETMINIPLMGVIAAGQPVEAIQNKETIAVPQNKLPRSGSCYALRVAGQSMIDENINDGDIVLIKQQTTAQNGQKIVALIDNYEATLKKFYRERGHIRLQPANKTMEPIIVHRNTPFVIQGIVIDIIKNSQTGLVKEFPLPKKIKRNTELPLNQIILNDAVEELKKLPDESCDVIIIDPPYNIGKDFGNNMDKREMNEYISWSKIWLNESIRILKSTGTMFIYGFSEILAYLSVEISINKRWLIWHYTNKNVASLNFWQRSHEAIICAWKDKPFFNRDEVREPYTEGFLNGAAGKIRKGTMGRFSKNGQETIYQAHESGALPRDVIKIPALAGGAGMNERWFICQTCGGDVFEPRALKKHSNHEIIKHPTQKPLEICRKLIKSAMPKKGGIVLVPFVGSGAECAAAKELNQNYIGFEINPDYVKIAERAIAAARVTQKLF
ncbi:repressor LexA [Candidatus Kuenenbacteria bacterium RIFCSPLOWO2_12_FULL_42_13]|uniref:LexA repressor n=2 Tax=Candidatus Kueneniibacteriota TaxID=1752740 RepID=A0A1F6G1D5_9BACT|nr:MAG: repressor LexA [Candidatus Kuenenbacteria bacterium RIFCSPLOWO2_12_FULL_42_13]OGG98524.1 MAG: repressor LexA [Candidatus Kuenenbacteria bacterium RIFCSPHIGHO2_12_FULL_42_14]